MAPPRATGKPGSRGTGGTMGPHGRKGALPAAVVSIAAALFAPGAVAKPKAHHNLRDYAHTTWASFVAMTDEHSGLPADSLDSDGTRSVQTSTTNIGAYMWSAVTAERLHIISHRELVDRLSKTITTLERMERYWPGGQYYNWYDYRTGEKLTDWPPKHDPKFKPFLSSVDNGWLATGLRVVANTVPELSAR